MSGLASVRMVLAQVATVEEVTLAGAVVVDVGLERVVKRVDGLTLPFSVFFVKCHPHHTPGAAVTPVETKNVGDWRSMLEGDWIWQQNANPPC